MLKSALAFSVSHEIGQPHLGAAPEQAWPRLGTERDDGPSASTRRVPHTRQVVREPLHPQPMEIDPDDLGGELTTPSDRHLRLRVTDQGGIIIGVGEGSHSARWHYPLPPLFNFLLSIRLLGNRVH